MPRYIALLRVELDEPDFIRASETAAHTVNQICDDSFTNCAKVVSITDHPNHECLFPLSTKGELGPCGVCFEPPPLFPLLAQSAHPNHCLCDGCVTPENMAARIKDSPRL